MRVWVLADRVVLQDENTRNDALRSIQENTAKMKNEKKKADQYEDELQREEKVLEGIRDSLKGIGFSYPQTIAHSLVLQIRPRYSMIRSSKNRRSSSLGKRRSTKNKPRLTSRQVSVTCWSKRLRQSNKPARRHKKRLKQSRVTRRPRCVFFA
jgi:hypothetical protein